MAIETIWITGASSGIGRELALQLARQGNRVLLSARSASALQEIAHEHENLIPFPCDVTDQQDVRRAAIEIKQRHGSINRLILNAGTCEYFDVRNPDWSMIDRVMRVNFYGSLNVFEAALPLLTGERHSAREHHGENGKPHVVVISSLVIAAPFPRSQAYGASKAALDYFFDAMRIDIKKLGVDVSIVQPGFVDTPLTRKNDFAMPFLKSTDFAVKNLLRVLKKRPDRARFPRGFSLLLQLLTLFSGVWNWIAVEKLSRSHYTGNEVSESAKG